MAIDDKQEQLRMMMGRMRMKMGMMMSMMMPKKKGMKKQMKPQTPRQGGSLRGNVAQWLKKELNGDY